MKDCPMRQNVPTSQITTDATVCCEEKCAWWTPIHKECAMLSISTSLFEISCTLNVISDRQV